MSGYGSDGANDRKDRKTHEQSQKITSLKDAGTGTANLNTQNPITYGGSKGAHYGHADGTIHQTTGGHRSSAHPTTSTTKCRCGATISKSLTVCNNCRK